MIPFETILTHPGGAHNDEFLACCVLLTVHPAPIVRREPTADDLSSVATCVVDVGEQHQPTLNNFDHHQLPKDHPPTCALSLVLQVLELYDDARRFCDWLETTEWFDARGPTQTAAWLGLTTETLGRLSSPVNGALLRQFALSRRLEAGQPLWEIMRVIGNDIVGTIRALRARLEFIGQHAEFWTVELSGRPAQILFLPRTQPLPDEPSFGIERFIQSRGLAGEIVGIVSPDRRGSGYALERFRDNPRLNFTQITDRPGVHYAHARGFVAKTSVTDVTQLKALVMQAAVKGV